MRRQTDELVHLTSSFQSAPVDGPARPLVETSPANLAKVHPEVPGGSSANEGTIKRARWLPLERLVTHQFPRSEADKAPQGLLAAPGTQYTAQKVALALEGRMVPA
ncbi:hypothetical protein [Streptomyces sp. NPDC051132]|uniref:hypothetical protein n=1 Tax=unclassified Streptomyces TaxID=2593676 RepID=UPI00342CA16E